MAKRKAKPRRVAPADESLAPSRERERHGLVEKVRSLSDSHGQIAAPYRAVDTLERMYRAKTIDGELRTAGERFRDDFARAHLEPLSIPRLDRIPGAGRAEDLSDRAMGARESVHRALAALGGLPTPVAEAAWAILGEGWSIKEWCERRPWGRGLKPETASGILIAALSLLASHYGLTRGRRRGIGEAGLGRR